MISIKHALTALCLGVMAAFPLAAAADEASSLGVLAQARAPAATAGDPGDAKEAHERAAELERSRAK